MSVSISITLLTAQSAPIHNKSGATYYYYYSLVTCDSTCSSSVDERHHSPLHRPSASKRSVKNYLTP